MPLLVDKVNERRISVERNLFEKMCTHCGGLQIQHQLQSPCVLPEMLLTVSCNSMICKSGL